MATPDFTDKYNTKLTPQEEAAYISWATKTGRLNDSFDYDMRGAWKSGTTQASNGHFPDTFKKPNHPTFSNESQYSGQDGFVGGTWTKDRSGRDVYIPSSTNLQMYPPADLQQYFKQVEPDTILSIPLGAKLYQ